MVDLNLNLNLTMLHLTVAPGFEAEKAYACSILLGELLGISFEIQYQAGLEHYHLRLPNGATLVIEDHFFGRQTGVDYLRSDNIPSDAVRMPHPFETGERITGIYGRPYFLLGQQSATLGIDLFASAFFMLTRWEEFVRLERDVYGRFPAGASLAIRGGFLDRPVVNEYADLLWQLLLHLGWNQPRRTRRFRLHLSHDVDHPRLWWSPVDRLRTLGGSLIKRRDRKETQWWLRNHFFRLRDPFDIFDAWMDLSEKQGVVSHFNFLGDRPRGSDCYYPLDHRFVRKLMSKIAQRGHVIGFHPSREAHADSVVFDRELASLRQVSPQKITSGRQHYLSFSAPNTWQRWADAGLEWDSTLGYSEAEGFRCGICSSFPVFNFLSRQVLPLREKPLIAMDVTLAQYRGYTPEQAYERLLELRARVQQHRGEFVLLWHNSSWNTYFWAPWREMYREFVQSC